MATTTDEQTEHPVLALAHKVKQALAAHTETRLWSMTDDETVDLIKTAAAIAAQVAELESRTIAHAETLELPSKAGHAGKRGTTRWLARTTHVTGPVASGKVKLARSTTEAEQTRSALARGEVHLEQATAITAMLGTLKKAEADTDLVLDPADLDWAEKFLLAEAADHDANHLTTLTQHLIEKLDPAGAEAHEAKLLEAQEKRAHAAASLRGRRIGDGMVRFSGVIGQAHWDMLKKPLHGLAAPKHVRAMNGAGSYDAQTPSAHKLGVAFTEYIERFPADKLPTLGGLSSTVVAVGDYEILLGKVKAAKLDTGTKISHTMFIRLAAANGLIPTWMDTTTGKPRVLALGRKKRLHTPDQRLAKTVEAIEDPDNPGGPTCETTGCTVPAYLCHLHHQIPWADGGLTDLDHAEFRCPYDHHQIHNRARNNGHCTVPGRDTDDDPP